MKTNSFSLVIAAAFLFMIAAGLDSCTKTDIGEMKLQNNQPVDTENGNGTTKTLEDLTHVHVMFNPWTGSTYYECIWPAANCLPEVVINGSSRNGSTTSLEDIYIDFKNSISQGTTDAFFMGSDYSDLFPDLDDHSLANTLLLLQSKSVKIIEFYHPDDDTYMYLVVDKDFMGTEPDDEDIIFCLRVKEEK